MPSVARFRPVLEKKDAENLIIDDIGKTRIMNDFADGGESLGLQNTCMIEFPDSDDHESEQRYLHFIVHYRPKDGLYRGAEILFDFDFLHTDFPYTPPNVKCLTECIWHPNIARNGSVCHSILHRTGEPCWRPDYTLSFIVAVLATMFDVHETYGQHSDSFNTLSPLNQDAAAQYNSNFDEYKRRVRSCVEESQRLARARPIKPESIADDYKK